MRRADRLFQIVQIIRSRRLTTASFLARRLEVSQRTLYRDIADLQHQGVPMEGEAGVGYRLGAGFELPPLMLTQDEATALVAALRLAQSWLDPGLALQAESALGKVLSVLPPAMRASAQSLAVYAPTFDIDARVQKTLQQLRESVQLRRKVQLHYRDAQGTVSNRVVRPLGCFYWGRVWTLAVWCESRADFRSFRIDRIASLVVLDATFPHEAERSLADFLRAAGASPEPV